jgi:hypothetical protein
MLNYKREEMNQTDYIKTVKMQGSGYLLNGTLSVPNAQETGITMLSSYG